MPKSHLSNDEFFTKLATLIESTQRKGHGSVFLTQKRLSVDSEKQTKQQEDQLPDLQPSSPLPIIVRASDGDTQSKDRVKNKSHVKISTIVQPDDIEAFFVSYAETCKAGMQSLKKRDRSKRKKNKKKAAAVEDEKKS